MAVIERIYCERPTGGQWGKFKSWAEIDRPRPVAAPPPVHAPDLSATAATKSKNLRNRARKKWLSCTVAGQLADLNSPLKFKYVRTLTCGNEIRQEGNTFTSRYCGARWCVVCQSIRMGKLIKRYRQIIESLERPHLITLTIKNIPSLRFQKDGFNAGASDVLQLRKTQRKMFTMFRKLQDSLRKDGIKLKGFRKYEIIVSKDQKGYRPHIHWVVSTVMTVDEIVKQWKRKKLPQSVLDISFKALQYGNITIGQLQGEFLIQYWLKQWGEDVAERPGQDCRPALSGSEVELFKYTTKMIVKSKHTNTTGEKGGDNIPLRLLDDIYRATENVRTVQCTGFITRKPKAPKFDYTIIPKWKMDRYHNEKDIMGDAIFTPVELAYLYDFREKEARHWKQCEEYDIYRELTALDDKEINEDLEAQEADVITPQNDVFVWNDSNRNWFSINTGQPLVRYSHTKKMARLARLLDSS